jgi:hypothetical protein
MQSKYHSFIESLTNTAIGYVVAILSQLAIFPIFGIYIEFSENLTIAAWFTVISIIRSYILRRAFTKKTECQ